MEGQIQIIEYLGQMHVSNTKYNGKEIVQEIQSIWDDPNRDVQIYNNIEHEGCKARYDFNEWLGVVKLSGFMWNVSQTTEDLNQREWIMGF